jgi:hypothetical protein
MPAPVTGIADVPPRLDEVNRAMLTLLEQDVWSMDGTMQRLRMTGGAYTSCSSSCDAQQPADGDTIGGPSLATDARYRLLAEKLTALGTYTALFSADTEPYVPAQLAQKIAGPDATVEEVQRQRGRLEAEPLLRPFEAFATGAGVDADGHYTALVLVHADGETAQANVQQLRARIAAGASWLAGQPYTELIDGATISAEGPLVIAKLRTRSAGLWFGLPAATDTLLLHE